MLPRQSLLGSGVPAPHPARWGWQGSGQTPGCERWLLLQASGCARVRRCPGCPDLPPRDARQRETVLGFCFLLQLALRVALGWVCLRGAAGSSQPHPLRREREHLLMWFAPNALWWGENKKKKGYWYSGPGPPSFAPARKQPPSRVRRWCCPVCARLAAGRGRRRAGFASGAAVEGAGWLRGSASLPCLHHGQRTVSARSPRPACPHLSGATCFPSPPGSRAGPQPTSYFLIARKWRIPPGPVSVDAQIPRLWPRSSFSFAA